MVLRVAAAVAEEAGVKFLVGARKSLAEEVAHTRLVEEVVRTRLAWAVVVLRGVLIADQAQAVYYIALRVVEGPVLERALVLEEARTGWE
jgi:hypothetical protein